MEENTIHVLLQVLHSVCPALAVHGGHREVCGDVVQENVIGTPLQKWTCYAPKQPRRGVCSAQITESRPLATLPPNDIGLGDEGAAIEQGQQLHAEAYAHDGGVREVQHRRRGLGHVKTDVQGLRQHNRTAATHDETHIGPALRNLRCIGIHSLHCPNLVSMKACLADVRKQHRCEAAFRTVRIVVNDQHGLRVRCRPNIL
mmetsp:Transcript_105153/g.267134  ORF Transcript_105153/g.267134 Transcript_105153/m.267134 type:complete len:201 (+) Transcript_105153:1141-1743(+)